MDVRVAVVTVLIWAAAGPAFGYSDAWQLTQNRDAKAIHLKLDELIRAVDGARTRLVRLEDMTDDERADLQEQFKRLHERLSEPGATEHRAA